jgi:hypothetical protein
MSNDDLFSLKLTEAQYTELARWWHEYMVLGPTRNPAEDDWNALDFCEWMDSDSDEDPKYGLPEVEAFLAEKERREGTALPEWAKE